MKKRLKSVFFLMLILIFIPRGYSKAELKSISNKYTNNYHGYEYNLKENSYYLDDTKAEVVVSLISDKEELKFFYDNLSDKSLSFSHFIYFANNEIYKDGDYNVRFTYEAYVEGRYAHIIAYNRRKLNRVENDKNNYATISIKMSDSEVLTFMIKSVDTLDKNKINEYIKNLSLINKTENIPTFKTNFKIANVSDKVKKVYNNNFVNSKKQKFGIYEPTFVETYNDSYLKTLENKFNYRFDMILSYQTNGVFLDDNSDNIKQILKDKEELLAYVKRNNRIPLFTISTFELENNRFIDKTLDLLDGKYDYVLEAMANNFKTVDIPILLRINNEMNGDWVTYCSHFQGKDPDIYVKSYRYIHDYFISKGVNNVLYVFNPNNKSFPDFSFNNYISYYPGDNYVDIVGLTAYNTGTYYKDELWSSFVDLYDNLYYEYSSRFKQPFIITEFSSSSIGGNKVIWFENMFINMKKYPKIKYAILWNGVDYDFSNPDDVKISRDYRIDQDEKLVQLLRRNLIRYR